MDEQTYNEKVKGYKHHIELIKETLDSIEYGLESGASEHFYNNELWDIEKQIEILHSLSKSVEY